MYLSDTGANRLQSYVKLHSEEKPVLEVQTDPGRACDRWLELYNSLINPHETAENLPLILLLIHPKFYFNREGINQHKHLGHTRKKMKKKTPKCELSSIIKNISCNSDARSEGDHHWPFTLGGSNDPANVISLCKQCNNWKSGNPWLYKWDVEEVPGWALLRLKQVHNLKA